MNIRYFPSKYPALLIPVLWLALPLVPATAEDPPEEHVVSISDCQYSAVPDEYLARESKARRETLERASLFGGKAGRSIRAASGARYAVSPSEIPQNNWIDAEIFPKLTELGIPSAPLSSDEEFLRRITFDLTGRAPAPAQVREFVADENPSKRTAVIAQLLDSPEFVDKWTLWLGDLFQNNQVAQNVNQQVAGRNRMHEWIRQAVESRKSFRDIAWESINGTGNTYDANVGQSNWVLKAFTPMGPIEDTYDGMLVRTASIWMGMAHYDCVLCHDGRGHLTSVSAWGRQAKREEAQRMAAFFARTTWQRYQTQDRSDPKFDSWIISERTAVPNAGYNLSSTSGNRPSRVTLNSATPPQQIRSYTPMYRDGKLAAGGNWREQFASYLIQDPMFARNLANRLWKAMFTTGLVEPVDNLDPIRLDPNQEPPAPWTFQTPHVVLLDKLARDLQDNDFNLRSFLKFLAESSAYQLSSQYDGSFDVEKVPYFPRHYARRLDAEEVHDALVRATGVIPSYTINGWDKPVSFAIQFPDTAEPRSNGGAAGFLNAFLRGNRDTILRSQNASILMMLNLMNNTFVTDRILLRNSPALQEISRMAGEDAQIEELWLRFLSRRPTESELVIVKRRYAAATSAASRNTLLEDLAWSLVNKTDFLFSY